ncbi:MAG: TetR family transcriptional regulator C-terminal domain-containing protein [Parvibaculaceae bacterium]|nr:TetR family transcriptional regulator C-terminal domain-containing protein [Parvibaculaceae bacterium]|tara:strand:+ start:1339 stop:1911 length:573 start_codon:yes stop_codon:yes gene_type:complete
MPKKIDPNERRRELVLASWDVLCADGLEGVSLRRVADAANCTTGRIAHYFEGRDQLLIASLRMANAQAAERMQAIAESEADSLKRLRAILMESLPLDTRRLKEWQVWLSFWAASIGHKDLAVENQRRYAEWRAALQSALRALTSESDATILADRLVTLIDGLGIGVTLDPSKEKRRRAEAEVDAFLNSLR